MEQKARAQKDQFRIVRFQQHNALKLITMHRQIHWSRKWLELQKYIIQLKSIHAMQIFWLHKITFESPFLYLEPYFY